MARGDLAFTSPNEARAYGYEPDPPTKMGTDRSAMGHSIQKTNYDYGPSEEGSNISNNKYKAQRFDQPRPGNY